MAKPPKDSESEAPKKGRAQLRVVPPAAPKKSRAKPGTGRNGARLPAHEPDDRSRLIVKMGVGIGYTQEQIARLVGISETTLKKYYPAELSEGADHINLQIASNLASIARSSTHPKAVTAAIFWMKARAGWTDRPVEEDDDGEEEVEFTVKIGEAGGAKGA